MNDVDISNPLCEYLKKQALKFCLEKEDPVRCREILHMFKFCREINTSSDVGSIEATSDRYQDKLPDSSFDIYKKSH